MGIFFFLIVSIDLLEAKITSTWQIKAVNWHICI